MMTPTLRCILFANLLLGLCCPAFSQTKTLTKEQYRDKTLAMVLGSIGGVLTGYEYLNVYNTPDGFHQPGATMKLPKEPILGMPDSWFIPLNGTLGGTTKDEYGYGSWYSDGRVNSDDDQHIDFFNQFLLTKYGPSISYEDIKSEWMAKQVSDFGGGQGAIEVMRDKDLMAPQCGHRDHGNSGHWLPECYIEHEMMGAAFPGMPNKSVEFTQRFSSMTGEGENVQWGYYWSAAHSVAFFETDIRVAVVKALGMLPANCRPRQMYDICVKLHQKYPTDWRAAVRELWKDNWSAPFAVGHDGIMLLSDVNNGTAFLSILYGNNDYMTTFKIVSIAGGDGDCTASAVCGLMGIIKGMAGTPAVLKDHLYKNGKGVWINDIVHAFSVKKDYKIEWTYDEIVDMYQQNAESMIRAFGGVVTSTGYSISSQAGTVPQIATINWDFENGNLDGWKTWTAGGSSSVWCEKQCNEGTKACFAATGKYKGTITTNSASSEAKLFQTVTGLKPGKSYKIEGRVNTSGGRVARLFVDNYGGTYKYASISKGVSPFPYMYLYVTMGATNTTMDVGLHATPSTNGTWCSIDDVIITEVENPVIPVRYEAEAAILSNAVLNSNESASGGKYVGSIDETNSYIEFRDVTAAYSGEYIVRINYANAGNFAQHKIYVNGKFIGLLEHSDTGPWGVFSANVTDAHVKLQKGTNTIRIAQHNNSAEIDYVELLSPYGSDGKPADDATLVNGGIYKIIAKHSNKVLDLSDGTPSNGDFVVQNTFTGASTQFFKLTKKGGIYSIAPMLNSDESIEILGASNDNEAKAGLWGYWGGDNQQWAIIDAGDGYFKILNDKSGKALDVIGNSMADGATVFQYDYLNGNNQKWRFDFVGMTPDDIPNFIPGQVEAEKYSGMFGVQTQATTDDGGGLNVGWIETGDWMDYKVNVETSGAYEVTFRIATTSATGQIQIKSGATVLATTSLPNSGGWQTWKDVTSTVTLNAGLQTLRVNASVGGFNLNHMIFRKKSTTNIAPVVTFVSPLNNAEFTSPANLSVRVNASDADGSVSNVKLYLNNVLVRLDSIAPYEWTDASLSGLAVGTYTLKAIATDNKNATGTAEITVVVKPVTPTNVAPIVTITGPSVGATFTASATIAISATATDADGTISKVEFYNGTTLLNSDATAPYSYSWTGVAAGTYMLNVKATDNLGATATKSVTVTVNNPVNTAPVLTITSPAIGASYTAPATVVIEATASDADGTVAKVEFYNGATLLNSDATAPYSYSWTDVAAGLYTLNVKAIDNLGASTTKSVSVSVGNPVSVVGINGPSCVNAGSTYTYTLNPGNGVTTNSWWSNSAATTTTNTSNSKIATVQIPAFMNGTTFTLYAGVNYSVSPWYKEYTKVIKVGGCTAAVLRAPIASPLPFDDETTIAFDDARKLVSVYVYDTKGILVFSEDNIMTDSYVLGRDLAVGVYNVKVVSEEGVTMMKIVKR